MRLPKALGLVSALALMVGGASAVADDQDRDDFRTATPIKHVVIIFQENTSFDHYFGTYPNALNLAGETPFVAKKLTPTANNLVHPLNVNNNFVPLTGVDLLNNNPNNNPNLPVGRTATNSTVASNPFRLSPAQALTDDQNHADTPEQTAYDNGKVDGFPAFAGSAGPLGTKAQVMGYFDGNTVTALWNYAQHFALNDNSYSSQFGPSTPGALNLISGQSNGVIASTAKNVLDGSGNLLNPGHIAFGDNTHSPSNLTVIGDLDPLSDLCSTGKDQTQLAGRNFGDLLNDKGITWGSFMGGFDLTVVNPDGSTGCARHHNPTAPGT